jgi:versiconal hemiacetal acetate reductase
MQNYYNLLAREEELEMIPYCLDVGVGIIPWSPLAHGALARPWDSRSTVRESSDGTLSLNICGRETEADKAIVDHVEEVAGKKGVSMAQAAMAWSLSKEGVNPIVGLSSNERIDEAVASVGVKLTGEEISYLEDSYVPEITLMEKWGGFSVLFWFPCLPTKARIWIRKVSLNGYFVRNRH